MNPSTKKKSLISTFTQAFARPPTVFASAPGRLEVLGNHTDYNHGLTLSCAAALRCYAALAPLDQPVIRLASTTFDNPPQAFSLEGPMPYAAPGRWENYILGLVAALRLKGHDVPGFELLIDSQVPPSAGLSSSAAIEMASLTAITQLIGLDLPALELATIGQWAESQAVGAQTGLLDQLTSLCGKRDHLLQIDFKTSVLTHRALPPGWAFVAVDSGVKHDLTAEYNQRRQACEQAAAAMGVDSLRDASLQLLESHEDAMPEHAYRCARHVLNENRRVLQAADALAAGDIASLGQLMFESHRSSQTDFCNSCPQLDELVAFADADLLCLGARLSGGGFGGITIHLVPLADANAYRRDITERFARPGQAKRWSAVCQIDDGASLDATLGEPPPRGDIL